MSDLTIGYAAMLEQFHPSEAVAYAALAEQHGFSGVMAADHYQPWVPQQGNASFVWNVLTAVGERTTGDFGPGVTAPTFRWHPAMVAQASATLAAMYPGRHWLGIGSGEALNEHIVGQYWPETPERINRMFEALDIVNKLFSASLAGRDVKHRGEYFKLESTRLWTMPETAPEVLVATAGPVTAKRRAGRHADGLITVGSPAGEDRRACSPALRGGGPRRRKRTPPPCPKCCSCTCRGHETDEAGTHQRDGGVAERRHAVSEGRHSLAVRVRAAGQARCAPKTSRGGSSSRADP